MRSPILTCDREANAVYIRLSDADVAETVELSESVYVDMDSQGEPVGFEILHAEPSVLARIPELPDTAALRDLVKHNAL